MASDKSRSPTPDKEKARSASRSRSRSRSSASRSRSRSRDRKSRSPARRYSGSRSPRERSRSRSGSARGDWKKQLERLVDRGLVNRRDLDESVMEALEDLDDDLAENAVQRFGEANFGRITNKSGFLMGIVRRIKEDGPDGGTANLDILSRSVRHRLRDLIDDGRMSKEEVDQRMCRALAELPSDRGLEAVDKFAMANLDNVRSKTGFMMGIIKRVQQDMMYGGPRGGPPPYRAGGGYGGGYRDDYYRGGPRYDDGYGYGARGGGYGRYDDYRGRDRYY
ncbi:hypothetical protein WJX72_008888 [[Myrmecia] bisecta]|uniref:Heterogeneous nuclear ribonucleoprotein Q acidic domain-containing protein n=1 Tax=[Myrmecia] bisecta TaxID=41462 RepID=A0AAW1QS59_9CHLO